MKKKNGSYIYIPRSNKDHLYHPKMIICVPLFSQIQIIDYNLSFDQIIKTS